MDSDGTTFVWMVVMIAIVAGLLVLNWKRKRDRVAELQMRSDAPRLGISVDTVDHAVPYYSSHNRIEKFATEPVTRLSMARGTGTPPDDWSLLMRPADGAEQYGEAFIFEAKSGAPSSRLREILVQIAETLSDDSGYIEFEAKGPTVAVYCEADIAASLFPKIREWLPQLARF